MNYTVFDVETANSQRASICAIGIIRYENGQVVYEKELLINPEADFNFYNVKIHGIHESDVVDSPTFPQIWEEIGEYFNNTILVAHNAKSMDLCALYRTLEKYNLPTINNQYICTYELAKEIFRDNADVQSYRLDVLSNLYNIRLAHHHDALDDARACFEILRKFEELYPEMVIPQQYYYGTNGKDCGNTQGLESIYSDKTKAMQKLQMLVIEIVADKEISDKEIEQLQLWLNEHEELKGYYPYDKIFEVVEDVLLDGVMDEQEKLILTDLFDAYINPQTDKAEATLEGKRICLSGEFVHGTKKQVEDWLAERGAILEKSVTGKLDILVLGESGSAAWKYGNYGSKYEKACQLNEKGKSIKILKESDVIGKV